MPADPDSVWRKSMRKNKAFSAVLIFALLLSFAPQKINAEEGESIICVSGSDLSAAELDDIVGETLAPPHSGESVLWFANDEEITDETKLDGDNLIITYEERGKTIFCTVDGEKSAEITVGASKLSNLGSLTSAEQDLLGDGKTEYTSAADTFKADGKKITLLDTYNNSKSTFVALYNPSKNRVFDTDGKYNYYNPERESNLAYFVNTDREKITIPDSVRAHINGSWPWLTEPAAGGAAYAAANGKDYTVRAGIVVPALWEVIKYKSIIGYADVFDNSYEMFRTAAYRDDGNIATMRTKTGLIYAGGTGGAKWYRTEFTLDRGFLLDENISLTEIGENVWRKIKELWENGLYTYEELAERFDESTLSANGIYPPDFNPDLELSGLAISDSDGSVLPEETLDISKYVGETLSVSYESTGAEAPGSVRLSWLVNGDPAPEYKLDGDSFIVTWEESEKTVTCSAVPYDGDGKVGKSAQCTASFDGSGITKKQNNTTPPEGSKSNTDAEDIVVIDGTELVMLDTFKNNKSAFLVSYKNNIGKRAFDTAATENTKINAIDPGSETNIAYYLNNDFYSDMLADGIKPHVNMSHVWMTEAANGGTASASGENTYYTVCGINILAEWEYAKYAPVLGAADGSFASSDRMYLRTPFSASSVAILNVILASGNGNSLGGEWHINGWSQAYVRPIFCLDRDTFLDKSLEIKSIGKNVWKKLAAVYSLEEMMEKGFGRTELIRNGFEPECVITSEAESDFSAARAEIRNNSSRDFSGTVINAVYDKNGKMLDACMLGGVFAAAKSRLKTDETAFENYSGAALQRSFFWNSLENQAVIAPHSNAGEGISSAKTGGAALSVLYNASEEKITAEVTVGKYDENANGNYVGITVLRPGKTAADAESLPLREVYYYIGEGTALSGESVRFELPFSAERGKYTVRASLPNGSAVLEEAVMCAAKSEYDGLLAEINAAIEKKEIARCEQLISENTELLNVENDVFRELSGDFMSEVSAAVCTRKYETVEALRSEIIKEFAVQLIKRCKSAERAAQLLQEYDAELLKWKTSLYEAYSANKTESGFVGALAQRLSGGSFKSASAFADYFDESVLLCAVGKLSRTKVEQIIEENGGYMKSAGIDTDAYNKLGSTKRAEAVNAVLGTVYASAGELAAALNAAIKTAGKSSSGGGGGGGGSSKSSGGFNPGKIPTPPQPYEKEEFSDLGGYDWAREAINALYGKGIVSGKEKLIFAPADSVKREEFAKIAVIALGIGIDSAAQPIFNDVKSGDWFAPYTAAAKTHGLINGISETEFGSGLPITREDMAVILSRMTDKRTGGSTAAFADADDISDYAREAVGFLAAAGIVKGDEQGHFNPKKSASRAECAKMVYEFMKYAEGAAE